MPLARGLSAQWSRWIEASRVAALPPGTASAPGVVVDVGAHAGNWAEAVLNVLAPGKLVAIEPAPEAFRRLSERFGGDARVELHQVAIGDTPGALTLHLFEQSNFNSALELQPDTRARFPDLAPVGSVEVPVRRLDEVVADEQIVLLKVDVQGLEAAVLRGAKAVLERTSVVLIETSFASHYRGDTLFCGIDGALREAGLALYRFASTYHDEGTGQLLWADAVFARHSSR
jgi:FkbM family methyltransferase